MLLGERPPLAALLGEIKRLLGPTGRQRGDLGLARGARAALAVEGVEDLRPSL
jgi:hypothetical protein